MNINPTIETINPTISNCFPALSAASPVKTSFLFIGINFILFSFMAL